MAETIEERADRASFDYYAEASGYIDQIRCWNTEDIIKNIEETSKSAYIKGATEQKAIDIDKACEWLKSHINNYLYNTGGYDEYIPMCGDKLYSDFRKAMEE